MIHKFIQHMINDLKILTNQGITFQVLEHYSEQQMISQIQKIISNIKPQHYAELSSFRNPSPAVELAGIFLALLHNPQLKQQQLSWKQVKGQFSQKILCLKNRVMDKNYKIEKQRLDAITDYIQLNNLNDSQFYSLLARSSWASKHMYAICMYAYGIFIKRI